MPKAPVRLLTLLKRKPTTFETVGLIESPLRVEDVRPSIVIITKFLNKNESHIKDKHGGLVDNIFYV